MKNGLGIKELSLEYIILQTMCEETDIKELGLPMGPRKKLLAFVKQEKKNKVSLLYNLFGNTMEKTIINPDYHFKPITPFVGKFIITMLYHCIFSI